MTRDEVHVLVTGHIADTVEGLPPERIDPRQSMRDYGLSSLDMVEVVSRSQRALKVKVPRAELRSLTTIDGLIELLHRSTTLPLAGGSADE